MKKQVFALYLFIYCLFPQVTLAARSVSITSDKSSLFGEEELSLSASMSGFTNGETIYLKGAFFKEGSTNYFGYTKKDESWVKNSTTAVDQRQITIGQWDGSVIVRSDFSDSGYTGASAYNLKLGYYYITSGGNISSVNWSSNILSIALDQPAPTPTESKNAQSPSPTLSIAQTAKSPITAKTVTPKITTGPSKSLVNVTQTPKNNNFDKISQKTEQSSIGGALTIKGPSPKKSKVKVLGAKENNFPVVIIIGGLFLLIAAGSWFGLKVIKEKGFYEKIFNK